MFDNGPDGEWVTTDEVARLFIALTVGQPDFSDEDVAAVVELVVVHRRWSTLFDLVLAGMVGLAYRSGVPYFRAASRDERARFDGLVRAYLRDHGGSSS